MLYLFVVSVFPPYRWGIILRDTQALNGEKKKNLGKEIISKRRVSWKQAIKYFL